MAAQSDGIGFHEAFVGIALVVGLVGFAVFQRATRVASRVHYDKRTNSVVGVVLHERPATALGAFLVEHMEEDWRLWGTEMLAGSRRLPRLEVVKEMAADRCVMSMNGWEYLWPIFLLLSVGGLVLVGGIATRKVGMPAPFRYLVPAAYVLVANGGLAVTLPNCASTVIRYIGLFYAGSQCAAGLFVLLGCLVAGETKNKRKLKYGPPFVLPTTGSGQVSRLQDGVLAGTVDKSILPAHTAWNADASGNVVIPFDRLSCSVTILGEKGSGKSRLLYRFHDAIRQRYPNVPMLIHDPKGEWFRTFYDPKTDLIFAPHFKGSTHWSIWSDFKQIPELCHELIATAVYAHDAKADTFWMDSAIRLLRSVAHLPTLDIARGRLNQLRNKNAVDKTWLSIYQVAQLGLEDITKVELPPPCEEGETTLTMSIDDYLRWPGRIFLLNDPSCATEQKGAFSLFLSAFMLRALSRDDLPAGQLRAVAIVDEALTFNLPPDVDRRIYAMCRSKGLSVIAGAQRLPNRYLHERGEWATAEFLFGMKVISQETQSSLSRRAGQMHFDQARKGRSESDGRVSISENDQAERIDAIPPEHFARLAPRNFVLFHDRGLVAGCTAPVEHEQRDMPRPKYDARHDVSEFGQPSASDNSSLKSREEAE